MTFRLRPKSNVPDQVAGVPGAGALDTTTDLEMAADVRVYPPSVTSGSIIALDVVAGSTSATGDSGAARFVFYHTSGNASVRATEHHVIRNAGSTANYTWAEEIGVHSEVAGNMNDQNIGLMIQSSHAGWCPTGVRNDAAIYIGGPDGWYHGILYYDEAGKTMLDLDQTGNIRMAGNLNTNWDATNGQRIGFKSLTELTTIAAAATTDTVIQMPAAAIILAVSVRVTVAIPTATNFTVGDSGSAARFSTAAVSSAANSTDKGTKAGAYYNAGALAVRITPDATPAANTGRVRVTIHYIEVTPPTS